MSPEGAVLDRPRSHGHLRLVPRRPLRVVDCALFYGEGTDEARAYLEAKVEYARWCPDMEHHLLVPSGDGRLPLGGRGLLQALDRLEPDVVLLHDPFWKAREVCRLVYAKGGVTVMVHHRPAAVDSGAGSRRSAVYDRALRAWLRNSYDEVDAVMSACDTFDATGRAPTIPLRFGLDRAFRPDTGVERGDHVLYAGRISADKGVLTLLAAMALSRGDWMLRLVGDGPALPDLWERARKLGVAHRIQHRSFVDDKRELAREYAGAACVVLPGARETFGLVALEAAACGVPVVAASTTPSVALIGDAAHTFPAGDVRGLLQALGRARLARHDQVRGEGLAQAHTWDKAFRQELRDLEALARW